MHGDPAEERGNGMDFQELADSYEAVACILSVDTAANGGRGEICIVAANQNYRNIFGNLLDDLALDRSEADDPRFAPGIPYDSYLPKNPAFEEFCYRVTSKREALHTYLHMVGQDLWFHAFGVPIDYEEDGRRYCAYVTKQTSRTSIQPDKISDSVLKTCIRLDGAEDFRTSMDGVIRDIRLLCNAEICTILLMDHDEKSCSVLATDLRENSPMKRVTEFEDFFSVADSWLQMMGDDDCIIIGSEEEMQHIRTENHAWWATLDEAGVNSLVLFPLRFNRTVLGFIWVTNFDTRQTDRIRETLEMTTFFLSSHISTYKMMQRLEHIGYTDMLTGVQNRNAMNNRVSSIVEGGEFLTIPFGVIFADLNGLKNVNDTQGHSAGDLLLKKAALLLQEHFHGEGIYRAGGDEFVVIVTGCSRETFEKRVASLKEHSDNPANVCFAVGNCYVESGCDIRKAMRLADENMYQDKEDFYRRHPENDRRKRNRT
jgi:diguanylate cyclase (GGDEF)-like protein